MTNFPISFFDYSFVTVHGHLIIFLHSITNENKTSYDKSLKKIIYHKLQFDIIVLFILSFLQYLFKYCKNKKTAVIY
jgi:hypothetical protein